MRIKLFIGKKDEDSLCCWQQQKVKGVRISWMNEKERVNMAGIPLPEETRVDFIALKVAHLAMVSRW